MMRRTHQQYFTPLPVARTMVDLLGIRAGESVIDPACGEAIFLDLAADRGARVSGVDIDREMASIALDTVRGKGEIYCHNGLYSDAIEDEEETIPVAEDAWDVVVGNPPFRSLGAIERRPEVLRRFALGCSSPTRSSGEQISLFYPQESLFDLVDEPVPLLAQAPEVLFLERFVRLARPGGRIAIVLPDGLASKAAWQSARDYLFDHCEVYAVLSLPREAFLDVGTEAKTVVVFARKRPAPAPPNGAVCLAAARAIGLRTDNDELPAIVEGYRKREASVDPLILWKDVEDIRKRMTPEYYHPRFAEVIDELHESGLAVKRLGELAPYTAYGQVGRREYDPKGGVQLLSIRNHEDTGVDFWEERRFVAQGGHNDPNRTRLEVGDVLVSNSGVRAIGRATLVTHLPTPANVTQHVQVVRPTPEACPEAIVIFLQSRYGQLQIEQRVTGVAAAGLTYDDIHSILVPDFRGDEAKRIAERYAEMDRHHRKAQEAREQIFSGHDSPATHRRFEEQQESAEQLRQSLVADMEETVRVGQFSF